MKSPSTDQRDTPEKWEKYEILEEFELAPIGYAAATIHRYPWKDRERLLEDLRTTASSQHEGAFWVVKFVPQHLSYLLPNHRVYRSEDIELLAAAFENIGNEFVETWACKTDIAPNLFSVAGRIIIDNRDGASAQLIEQVWKCSPRLIEKFGKDFPFPYVRATRANWGWSAKIEDYFIPSEFPISQQDLCSELGRVLASMYPMKEKLLRFERFLFACGCDAISLEYKMEGNSLRFIDWDTHQDRIVLRCWKQHKSHI